MGVCIFKIINKAFRICGQIKTFAKKANKANPNI